MTHLNIAGKQGRGGSIRAELARQPERPAHEPASQTVTLELVGDREGDLGAVMTVELNRCVGDDLPIARPTFLQRGNDAWRAGKR